LQKGLLNAGLRLRYWKHMCTLSRASCKKAC